MGERPRVLTEQVVVRLEPDLLDALVEHGEAHERNLSQTIRFAIRSYLVGLEPGPENAGGGGEADGGDVVEANAGTEAVGSPASPGSARSDDRSRLHRHADSAAETPAESEEP